MTWQLIGGAGTEHQQLDANHRGDADTLCFPTYAGRANDGTYVIAEERGIERQVPFRLECRTIRVDQQGQILFDSTRLGWTDAHGCLLHDGDYAILRRTTWELYLVSPLGQILDCLRLHRCSKRLPRYVRVTAEGTFLVVFYNRSFELDIVELSSRGELLWYLPSDAHRIGIPAGVQLTSNDTLLVADGFRHVVCELSRAGQLVWQFGEADHPANDPRHCSSPTSIGSLPDNQILVADSRNHRLISIKQDHAEQSARWSELEAMEIPVQGAPLCDPVFADRLPDGNLLICDPGNREVREIDAVGQTVWRYGDTPRHRRLSYPRSVEARFAPSATSDGEDALGVPDCFVVADTGSDRVLALQDNQLCEWAQPGSAKLFWPRCARTLPSGNLLIADARHGRIVELSPEGRILRQLDEVKNHGVHKLDDPHDVRLLPNDHLLITDSTENVVLEADWSGTYFRSVGAKQGIPLKDPHSAQQLHDGTWVIADTGHHRILFVGSNDQIVGTIDTVRGDATCWRLHLPRYAEVAANGTLVITDTGQNRILGATMDGGFLWELSHIAATSLSFLNQPRWATMVGSRDLLVSDHFHHRILHLRWMGEELPAPNVSANAPATSSSPMNR